VKVTNRGSSPVRVSRVRLETATFQAPVEEAKDSLVGPGLSVDLTLPLGEPSCGRDGVGEDAVTLDVDGHRVVLPVAPDVLDRVRDGRCQVALVGQQVELALSPGWEETEVRGRPAVRGTLEATPSAGAGRLTVSLQGATTLFTVVEPSAAELSEGTGQVSLPVALVVTRCDPHAVAEDKKGYLLPVRVAVDGSPAVLVEVPVPVPERGPLEALIDRSC